MPGDDLRLLLSLFFDNLVRRAAFLNLHISHLQLVGTLSATTNTANTLAGPSRDKTTMADRDNETLTVRNLDVADGVINEMVERLVATNSDGATTSVLRGPAASGKTRILPWLFWQRVVLARPDTLVVHCVKPVDAANFDADVRSIAQQEVERRGPPPTFEGVSALPYGDAAAIVRDNLAALRAREDLVGGPEGRAGWYAARARLPRETFFIVDEDHMLTVDYCLLLAGLTELACLAERAPSVRVTIVGVASGPSNMVLQRLATVLSLAFVGLFTIEEEVARAPYEWCNMAEDAVEDDDGGWYCARLLNLLGAAPPAQTHAIFVYGYNSIPSMDPAHTSYHYLDACPVDQMRDLLGGRCNTRRTFNVFYVPFDFTNFCEVRGFDTIHVVAVLHADPFHRHVGETAIGPKSMPYNANQLEDQRSWLFRTRGARAQYIHTITPEERFIPQPCAIPFSVASTSGVQGLLCGLACLELTRVAAMRIQCFVQRDYSLQEHLRRLKIRQIMSWSPSSAAPKISLGVGKDMFLALLAAFDYDVRLAALVALPASTPQVALAKAKAAAILSGFNRVGDGLWSWLNADNLARADTIAAARRSGTPIAQWMRTGSIWMLLGIGELVERAIAVDPSFALTGGLVANDSIEVPSWSITDQQQLVATVKRILRTRDIRVLDRFDEAPFSDRDHREFLVDYFRVFVDQMTLGFAEDDGVVLEDQLSRRKVLCDEDCRLYWPSLTEAMAIDGHRSKAMFGIANGLLRRTIDPTLNTIEASFWTHVPASIVDRWIRLQSADLPGPSLDRLDRLVAPVDRSGLPY